MNDNENKMICPACGATIVIGVAHSCQDSVKDEKYHMIGNEQGLSGECLADRRKQDEEWEKNYGMMGFSLPGHNPNERHGKPIITED